NSTADAATQRATEAGLPVGYRLHRLLGKGAFGEVWQTEAPGGVPSAVKIIQATGDPMKLERERQALEWMKELRHTFLVPIKAFWIHPQRILIEMGLADGSLGDRLRTA